jgi:hypothetical protein
MTAAAKSSFSLRGPLSEKNPTLARTPPSPSVISLRFNLMGWMDSRGRRFPCLSRRQSGIRHLS